MDLLPESGDLQVNSTILNIYFKKHKFNSVESLDIEELQRDNRRQGEEIVTGFSSQRSKEDDTQINSQSDSGFVTNSTTDDNQESMFLIESDNKISPTAGNNQGRNMSIDSAISLLDNLTEEASLESQHLCTQEENSHVDRNVNGTILRQDKTVIQNNRCRKIGLLLSLMVNIALTTVIILFLCYKMNFKRKPVEEKNWTSLCVLENHKSAVCSDHSKHLQYLLIVMQTTFNISTSSATAQSCINFTGSNDIKNKESPTQVNLEKTVITNETVLFFQDNHIVIKKSSTYLLSFQLLFKLESRWKKSTENVTVTVTKGGRNGTKNAALMSQLALIPDGIQTLQTVHMMDIFNLKEGDKINLIVSAPSLLYNCKDCNKITAVEVV